MYSIFTHICGLRLDRLNDTERNYKVFANPVFINPLVDIYSLLRNVRLKQIKEETICTYRTECL